MGAVTVQLRLLGEDGSELKKYERQFTPKEIDDRFAITGWDPLEIFDKIAKAVSEAKEKQNSLDLVYKAGSNVIARELQAQRYQIWCALGNDSNGYAEWAKNNPIELSQEGSTDKPVLENIMPPIAGPSMPEATKKRRGRPPKVRPPEEPILAEAPQPESTPQAEPVKKRRGRPPKIKPVDGQPQAEPVKKRRGRPPKVRVEGEPEPLKKRRGRPPKNPAAVGAPVKRGPGRPRKNP